jgi:hypothetical protein
MLLPCSLYLHWTYTSLHPSILRYLRIFFERTFIAVFIHPCAIKFDSFVVKVDVDGLETMTLRTGDRNFDSEWLDGTLSPPVTNNVFSSENVEVSMRAEPRIVLKKVGKPAVEALLFDDESFEEFSAEQSNSVRL